MSSLIPEYTGLPQSNSRNPLGIPGLPNLTSSRASSNPFKVSSSRSSSSLRIPGIPGVKSSRASDVYKAPKLPSISSRGTLRMPKMPGLSGSSLYGRSSGTYSSSGPSISLGSSTPAKKSSTGGVLGAIEGGAHWLASKADLAAHDIAAIPVGLYDTGAGVVHDLGAAAHGDLSFKDSRRIGKAMIDSSIQSLEHPLRDPFQTLLTAGMVVDAPAGLALRGAAALDAAKAADAAAAAGDTAAATGKSADVVKAFLKKPVKERIIQEPTVQDGQIVHTPVQLTASHGNLSRILQMGHDAIGQRALNKEIATGEQSRIGDYMRSRIGKANDEALRRAEQGHLAAVSALERSAKSFDKGVSKPVGEAAMLMHANNLDPAAFTKYYEDKVAAGVNTAEASHWAQMGAEVQKLGLLTRKSGQWVVDATKFPKLGEVAKLAKSEADKAQGILAKRGALSAEGMQARLDLFNRVMAGGKYEMKTLDQIDKPERYINRSVTATVKGKSGAYEAQGLVQSIDKAKSSASVRFFKKGGGAYTKDVPLSDVKTNEGHFVGGENAAKNPEGFFTSLKTSEAAKQRTGTMMRSRGISLKKPDLSKIVGKTATGSGIEEAFMPDNITKGVAQHAKDVRAAETKYQAIEHLHATGSDVYRPWHDVIAFDPNGEAAQVAEATKIALGESNSLVHTLHDPAAEQGALAWLHDVKDRLLISREQNPALFDKYASGELQLPAGARWQTKRAAGSLMQEITPRSAIGKKANDINAAVTSATVYLKLSHIPQRGATNAFTSFISGALLNPRTHMMMRRLKGDLTPTQWDELGAITGGHGYAAMPAEGDSKAAVLAREGVQVKGHTVLPGALQYARYSDAPIRKLNLVHEARKAGFTSTADIQKLIAYAKDPYAYGDATQTAKMEGVLRRANRVSMMYDGLGPNEQRIIARAVWFYPWTKAATRYAGHIIAEHPIKAGIGGGLAAEGKQTQAKLLGDLPSYEYNLLPLSGGAFPLTVNPSGLSPLGTAANIPELIARPGELVGNLNPVLGAAATLGTGVNSFGNKTKAPVSDALQQLIEPTPEMQILNAYLNPSKSTSTFQNTPGNEAVKSLIGPFFTPRKTNKAALNKNAKRQRQGN